MKIKTVGVIGCGVMGNGVTLVCAQSGYHVTVSEVNEKLLKKGLETIDSILTKSVEKGKTTQQDKDATMTRIKGTTDMKDFSDCDMIIEAAVEKLDVKKQIFTELDKICHTHTILGTNTSCLPITEIATVTSRPDKVLGIHFFNPVPVMKLLEIVKTILTSDETLETVKEFGETVGKTSVVAKDTPGFLVNSLHVPQLLNAIRMLENSVATKEDIDTSVRLGLNHPLGPLALADLVGLDTEIFIASAIYEETKDPQFIVPQLLKKMVAAGWLGRKTGRGFYDYT
ncbi:3-hydroxyacyl-CoA dehydrogenase family protein [Chloroflexota bacterium]